MRTSRAPKAPQVEATTSSGKTEKAYIVFRDRKIYPLVERLGWGSIIYLGVVYFFSMIGNWADIGINNEDIVLLFEASFFVAIGLALLCWRLAGMILGGSGK